jgi:ketosteroid isomerase-like protein
MSPRLTMFEALERLDAAGWAGHLALDAVVRLGNQEPTYGRDACRDAFAAFLEDMQAIRHDVVEHWEHGNATIVEATIMFTRGDGSEEPLPAVTIYRTNAAGEIADYRVYFDPTPLLAQL